MKNRLFAVVLFLLSLSAVASPCPQFSPNGQDPVLQNVRMRDQARQLCYTAFTVMHSGKTHTPLWVAEHLTRDTVLQAKEEVRTNQFYAEPRLPYGEGATLEDYRRSGYDRGHNAPAGDAPTPQAMAESFTLANMIPQNPTLNRHLWAHIESRVRALALRGADLYVVTGPLFLGSQLQAIGRHQVIVPTHMYKLVYDTRAQRGFVVVVRNEATNDYDLLSIREFEQMSQIQFPGIPETVKIRKSGGV